VADADAVAERIAYFSPDLVVHLAAMASVPSANQARRQAFKINFEGTFNVAEALRLAGGRRRLFYVSSAEVYGRSLLALGPNDESRLLEPTNAYAASKAAADILVRQIGGGDVATLVVRPFNHIGAGQSREFVVPSFCSQIAAMEAGRSPPTLQVGSLDDERDFLHVEDVIEAYVTLIERFDDQAGRVFNIASGRGVRIGAILERLKAKTDVNIQVQVDPGRFRPEGVTRIIGEAAALRRAVGWAPRRSLESALEEVLAAARQAQSRPQV
jgi:GDP-4-dehydro-6-deoxy-D-mannose reductase